MSAEAKETVALLQGTLDLIVLRALSTMGPQHAYAITNEERPSTRLPHHSYC
jgi:hypothetical protein